MASGIVVGCLVLALVAACGAQPQTGGASVVGSGADVKGSVTVDADSAPEGTQLTYMGYTDTVELNDAYMKMLEKDADWVHSDYIREVIKDRKITADEMNETERRSINCFAQYGLKVGVDYWFGDNGSGSVDKTNERYTMDQRSDIDKKCGLELGYDSIKQIYYEALRNPNNVDLDPYIFQCYQEHDLLDKNYTYAQFKQEQEDGNSPISSIASLPSSSPTMQQLTKCIDDPLHNISNSPLKGQ